ncbi:MSEP-CTERM sorting domain-containing protein [Dysgonomonas termitidis]|uniref:MSEP-CTERM sorting domain-containing protein n=1 Tax=Dysgonomonas termitidis TaxID=1516126 RepID=A0ABV9KSL1_9BACT
MRKLLNPKWIFLINTLPVALILFLEWGEFQIIKSLLEYPALARWKTFALVLLILALLNAAYAIVQTVRKKRIDMVYCIVSFVAFLCFIYIYYYNYDDLVPSGIPDWMISGNLPMYAGAFLMPTLIHALFALALLLTPHARKQKASINIVVAISIPFFTYVFATMVLPLWDGMRFGSEHLYLVSAILATTVFLFFIIRFIYILISRRNIFKEYELAWKIPVAIIFPILGLYINKEFDNLFGNFSDPWFYITAVTNGLLICIPAPENRQPRLWLYTGRCITFMYTLYFFLVMLPFLPLSVFAIIIFGGGFLMLTPLILFPIHLNDIVKDFNNLKRSYKKPLLYTITIISISTLPIAITVTYKYDRSVLHTTLEYLYSPDYTKEYKLNGKSVERILEATDTHDRRGSTIFYSSTPYLSGYYKWLVLDNLTLPESKRKLIYNLFNGSKINNYRDRNARSNTTRDTTEIKITDIRHSSKYDSAQKAWVSWIDLSIHNKSAPLWNAEYITKIDLPAGCWISDYYLYIGDVKEPGILAEKKAATWVFNQIRNVNRDPGLLRYLSGNSVEFKVFPFQTDETRYTGIEFIHKEPVTIDIDNNLITLGDTITQMHGNWNTGLNGVVYISGQEKQKLETVLRKPYYHFIADMSANVGNYEIAGQSLPEEKRSDSEKAGKYIDQIHKLLDRNLIDRNNAKISFTNTYIKTFSLKDEWQEELKKQKSEGGFFLDRAVKKILFDSYTHPQTTYPVIVVLSDNIQEAVLYNDFAGMEFTYPEGDRFYSLQNDSIKGHSFSKGIKVTESIVDSIPLKTVKVWPSLSNPLVYLPNDDKASVILNTKDKTLAVNQDAINKKSWETGLLMQAQWMLQTLHPETAEKEWLSLLQNSFESGIMSPPTSYIVVENDAQKAILKKKQEEVMSGHRALDLNDETQPMSEPDLFILMVLSGLFYLWYRRRKAKIPE